jgi:cytoskeletal protein RodZ
VVSFGQNLRKAREARNITLQEIAATTKIGTRALQAMENDRFDELPGGIFNKGFVRAYARCVGLDEEKTVAAYLEAAKATLPETDMEALASQVSTARASTRDPWWSLNAATFVGILAVIVAFGLAALWLKEHRREARDLAAQSRTATAVAPASVPPQTSVTASDPNASLGGIANTGTNGTINAAGTASTSIQPTSSAIPSATESLPQNANPGKNQAGTPVAGALGQSSAAVKESTAPVEISVSATSRAWISVRSDGKPVETLTLDPEKPEMRTRSYSAKEKLTLIAGNPAGLTVIYNGKPAGTLGTAGQRATITFTPQGIDKQ